MSPEQPFIAARRKRPAPRRPAPEESIIVVATEQPIVIAALEEPFFIPAPEEPIVIAPYRRSP